MTNIQILNMLCKDYNAPVVVLLLLYLTGQAVVIVNMVNDRKNNAKDFKAIREDSKKEFGHVYERLVLQEKKNNSFESGLKEVAKGQVETDKKVVEVLHEVREAKINLEEKFKRYHAEREEEAGASS